MDTSCWLATPSVDRRSDVATADHIDICLIYLLVYGPLPTCVYLHECGIPWHVALRLLTTQHYRRRH